MSKNLALLTFTLAMPLLFSVTVLSLLWYGHKRNANTIQSMISRQGASFTAVPTFPNMADVVVSGQDARVEIVRQFFARYNSPLEPYSKHVVEKADHYGLDFRLVPAIAMQESTLCKKIPIDSHNCWGFGIYGKKMTKFDNFEEAIDTVTKTLANNYKKDGLHTPEEIMSRYTPSNNGAWADGVTTVMNALQ